MKGVFLIAVISTILTTPTLSQNIYTALQHDRQEDVGNKVPVEIAEENLFYTYPGKEINKNKKKLNSTKRILTEERFGSDGKLTARLTFTYDSSGMHSLTRKFENWTKLGLTSETAFYEYDNNWHLIRVTDKTNNGVVIQETILTNDEKGKPIRLELFDGNRNLYGTETAFYDYAANKVHTEVYDNRGNSLSKSTLAIDYAIKDPSDVYNDKGDLIQSSENFYEYEYDEFGNWTMMKTFENVNGKKKKDSVFKRRLTYNN